MWRPAGPNDRHGARLEGPGATPTTQKRNVTGRRGRYYTL